MDLWFQRVTVREDWAKAWRQEAGIAEISHRQPKAGGRGHTMNGVSFETSKPVLCDTPLTRSPHLIFPTGDHVFRHMSLQEPFSPKPPQPAFELFRLYSPRRDAFCFDPNNLNTKITFGNYVNPRR